MNLALFDFDGTITTTETFGRFVRFAAPASRVAAGSVILAPLVAGYRLGVVSGPMVRASVARFAFTGVSAKQFDASGRRFAEEALPSLLRKEACERIEWHKAQGDVVVVVSGAFDCYLSHWCQRLGLELVCSSLERDARGSLTGKYDGAQCVGREKVRRVRSRFNLESFGQVYAYGDTKEDHEMLAFANKRVYRWREAA